MRLPYWPIADLAEEVEPVREPIFVVDCRAGHRDPLLARFLDSRGRELLVVEVVPGLQEIELPTGDTVRLDWSGGPAEEITWPVMPPPALLQQLRVDVASAELQGPLVPRPGDGPSVPARLRRGWAPRAKNTKARRRV